MCHREWNLNLNLFEVLEYRGGWMDGWMDDGRPREDVEEYVEGWNVVAKFFHYDVSWGEERVLALMRFCIFYAPWSLVTLAVIKFCAL